MFIAKLMTERYIFLHVFKKGKMENILKTPACNISNNCNYCKNRQKLTKQTNSIYLTPKTKSLNTNWETCRTSVTNIMLAETFISSFFSSFKRSAEGNIFTYQIKNCSTFEDLIKYRRSTYILKGNVHKLQIQQRFTT